jgi:small subunit ribosomal protein S4
LREKQKARRFYGVLEKQFEHYYEEAAKHRGVTGENLLQILESRLDNVAHRLGFGASRAEARQIVRHGHLTVNGKRVDIPSFMVKVGDVIAVREKSQGLARMKELIELSASKTIPQWLELDAEKATAKVVRKPAREEIDTPVAEQMIVEYYSR